MLGELTCHTRVVLQEARAMVPQGGYPVGLVRSLYSGEDRRPYNQEQEVEGDEDEETHGGGSDSSMELHRATDKRRDAAV